MTAEPKYVGSRRAPLQKKHFIIATAGHVDHGKSALVKALTGTDPDRLPEEKARGITIDLGFAELNLSGPSGDEIHAGIVDVPGHEDFVRNMIAGAGSVDLALFVVAADDGWMPQTEEHLQILTYLGVRRAVVALTKCDLAGSDMIRQQIRDQLRETPLARSPIVPTSVRTGEGIERLKSSLAAELAQMQPQRDYGKPRLFVDRAFTLHGIGTVVTGTLTGGQLHRDQTIVIQPQNVKARIRSLQSHGCELECAQPGMRTAINLADVKLDEVGRGDVITIDIGSSSATLLARIEQSPRAISKRSLRNGSSIHLHHGTSRVPARISFLEDDGIGQLKLASPIFAFVGDRFVIRDPSERQTIGGGVVLDPDGERHLGLCSATDDIEACVRAEIARRHLVQTNDVLTKSHFSMSEIGAALNRLEQRNQIILRNGIAIEPGRWQKLRADAIKLIDDAHKRKPDRAGLDLSELNSVFPLEFVSAIVTDLCTNGFVRRGSAIARAHHHPALPISLRSAEKDVREALTERRFDPPARKEIEKDDESRQVIRFLIEIGEAIEIGSDVIVLRDNFEKMTSRVVEFISQNGPATVSQLREALQSSRRVIVPFLEKLDRDKITQRVGDKRVLAKKPDL